MTKKEVRQRLGGFRKEFQKLLKSEKVIIYTGKDDDFGDSVSHFYGDLAGVLDSMDCIVNPKSPKNWVWG